MLKLIARHLATLIIIQQACPRTTRVLSKGGKLIISFVCILFYQIIKPSGKAPLVSPKRLSYTLEVYTDSQYSRRVVKWPHNVSENDRIYVQATVTTPDSKYYKHGPTLSGKCLSCRFKLSFKHVNYLRKEFSM